MRKTKIETLKSEDGRARELNLSPLDTTDSLSVFSSFDAYA
jgi:hypothetical protein